MSALDELPAFVAKMEERLRAGVEEYGDRSFSEHPMELLREIEEELIDTANWAFIGASRIGRIRRALEKLERINGQSETP